MIFQEPFHLLQRNPIRGALTREALAKMGRITIDSLLWGQILVIFNSGSF